MEELQSGVVASRGGSAALHPAPEMTCLWQAGSCRARRGLLTRCTRAAGDSKQIKAFAKSKGFNGSLFDKVEVNGPNGASPQPLPNPVPAAEEPPLRGRVLGYGASPRHMNASTLPAFVQQHYGHGSAMLLTRGKLWCAAEPLYGFLKSKKGGLFTSDIKWNFSTSRLFY